MSNNLASARPALDETAVHPEQSFPLSVSEPRIGPDGVFRTGRRIGRDVHGDVSSAGLGPSRFGQ
jgi:hypothetical protein